METHAGQCAWACLSEANCAISSAASHCIAISISCTVISVLILLSATSGVRYASTYGLDTYSSAIASFRQVKKGVEMAFNDVLVPVSLGFPLAAAKRTSGL